MGGVKAGPGPEVDEPEELDRVIPALEALRARFDTPLSVDTWRASVAKEAYAVGAVVGNDISGFADPEYLAVAAAAGATVVATHIRLGPRIPDPDPVYDDVVEAVRSYLLDRATRATTAGLPPDRIVLDAGLDLGKTAQQSLTLLRASDRLADLGYPLLLSASNKTFLGVVLGLEIGERREASLAATALGAALGCRIVRVHDVAAHREVCAVLGAVDAARRTDRTAIGPVERSRPVSAAGPIAPSDVHADPADRSSAGLSGPGERPVPGGPGRPCPHRALVAGGDPSLMVEEFGGPGVEPFDVGRGDRRLHHPAVPGGTPGGRGAGRRTAHAG